MKSILNGLMSTREQESNPNKNLIKKKLKKFNVLTEQPDG